MGTGEIVTILAIILSALVLSLVMRRAKQPFLTVDSTREPEAVFWALQNLVASAGWNIEAVNEHERWIRLRARIKCFDLLLYRVWADRITLAVNPGTSSPSRIVVLGHPAPFLLHVWKGDSLYIDETRLRNILLEASNQRLT